MDKNDVGAGYIALKIGDTLQDGDQRYVIFCWIPVPKSSIGAKIQRMHWPMRRLDRDSPVGKARAAVDAAVDKVAWAGSVDSEPSPKGVLAALEFQPQTANILDKAERDSDFLRWVADRLVHVHGDPENVDFVLRLRELADQLPYRRKVSEPSKVPTPIPSTDNSAACVPISKGLFAPVLEGPKGSSIFHRDFQAVEAKVYGTLASLGLLHLLPKPFTPNKYTRDLVALDGRRVPVDVYCVLAAFPTGSSAIDHAVKKELAPGQRGQKDRLQDLKEARASLDRAIQMEEGA